MRMKRTGQVIVLALVIALASGCSAPAPEPVDETVPVATINLTATGIELRDDAGSVAEILPYDMSFDDALTRLTDVLGDQPTADPMGYEGSYTWGAFTLTPFVSADTGTNFAAYLSGPAVADIALTANGWLSVGDSHTAVLLVPEANAHVSDAMGNEWVTFGIASQSAVTVVRGDSDTISYIGSPITFIDL
jgi:hypothetical protein